MFYKKLLDRVAYGILSNTSKVCGVPLDDWANGGYVDGLLSGVVSYCWCKFFGELFLFQGRCMEFRDKIIPHCSREVKCHADCSWLNCSPASFYA